MTQRWQSLTVTVAGMAHQPSTALPPIALPLTRYDDRAWIAVTQSEFPSTPQPARPFPGAESFAILGGTMGR